MMKRNWNRRKTKRTGATGRHIAGRAYPGHGGSKATSKWQWVRITLYSGFTKIWLSQQNNFRFCFFDGYCSTVQGLLDWFEVDLGFTELSFIQIDLCVLCVFVLYSRVSLSSCPFCTFCTASPRGGSASRVSPQSCQSHESLWGSWYSRLLCSE